MNIRGAGLLILNKNKEILVLHRKKFVPEGGKWGLPGGKRGKSRTFLETAVMKTKEETGMEFDCRNLKHLDTFRFASEGKQIIYDVWIAQTLLAPGFKINLNTEGHDEYKWEDPKSLLKRNDLMEGMYPILKGFLQLNT